MHASKRPPDARKSTRSQAHNDFATHLPPAAQKNHKNIEARQETKNRCAKVMVSTRC
jgi:hypothetical protein